MMKCNARTRAIATMTAAGAILLLAVACDKPTSSAVAIKTAAADATPAAETAVATPVPAATAGAAGLEIGSVRPVSATQMVKGVSLADPSLFLYAKIHSPARAFDRVTSWVTQLNPDTTSAAFRQTMTATGFDPAQFRVGSDVTFCQWIPPSEGANPDWALQLPLTANAPMQLMLSFIAPAHTMLGYDEIVANSQDTADTIDGSPAALTSVSGGRMQGDLEVGVNVAAMYGYYGKKLREQIDAFQQTIADLSKEQGDEAFIGRSRAQQRQMKLQTDAMFALAEQIQSLCFSLSLDPDAANMTLYIEPKQGSLLAEVMDKAPTDPPDISKFLGGGHTIAFQIDLAGNKDLIADYLKYSTSLFPEDKAEMAERLRQGIDKLMAAGVSEYAMAADLATSKTVLGGAIIQIAHPAELTEFARQNADLLALQALGGAGSIDFKIDHQENVRQVKEQPVDHYNIDFTIPTNIPEEQARLLKMLWGEGRAQVESMPFGDAALVSFGMPIEKLVDNVMENGAATGANDGTLLARRTFPAGGFLYADVDMAGYIKTMTARIGWRQPTNEVQSPPLSVAAYHQNGVGYYRARLPIETFAALRGIAPPPGMGGRGGRGQNRGDGPPPGSGTGMRFGRAGRRGGAGAQGRGTGMGNPRMAPAATPDSTPDAGAATNQSAQPGNGAAN